MDAVPTPESKGGPGRLLAINLAASSSSDHPSSSKGGGGEGIPLELAGRPEATRPWQCCGCWAITEILCPQVALYKASGAPKRAACVAMMSLGDDNV